MVCEDYNYKKEIMLTNLLIFVLKSDFEVDFQFFRDKNPFFRAKNDIPVNNEEKKDKSCFVPKSIT